MMSRTYWIAFLLALIGLAPWVGVQAQSGTPVIRSFTVDQVPELVPGTELPKPQGIFPRYVEPETDA